MTNPAPYAPGGQYTPITTADIAEMRRGGFWDGRTLRSVLSDTASRVPDRIAVVGYRKGEQVTRHTYAELDNASHDAARMLAGAGVTAGDVVAVMLPNRWEYPAVLFGINEIGAVYTGIPVAYGELQARAILEGSQATVLVTCVSWRRTDQRALARRMRNAVPSVRTVVLLDSDPSDARDGEVTWTPSTLSPEPGWAPGPGPDPEDLCYLGFTSGTTGAPKGAMHTHETLIYPARALSEHIGADAFGTPWMTQLVASPMGHHTGFVWGILLTVYLGGTAVAVDQWDPAWVADVIRLEGATAFFGAPTFLQDLMRTDLAGDVGCPLTCVVLAGSSVPRMLPAKAGAALGCLVVSAWGMTECGILTSGTRKEPEEILSTDGSPTAGSAVRVVGPHGDAVPPGTTGQLLMRGPGVTLGYFNRRDATEEAFVSGLWFATGDTASVDSHGWLTIRGRTKDIVIRGGENIPVTDIETLLFDHPLVLDAAIVGYPDDRLGERACAVIVTRNGERLELSDLAAYLLGRGLSKHYLPERLLLVDALPMTQSGKVQKFKLRELVRSSVSGADDNDPQY